MEKTQDNTSLRMRVINGIAWNVFELLGSRGISFVVKLILTQLLLPEHFGIIGMAVVFTGLINTINDLGMAAALVQFKQDRLLRIHYDTVFWLTTLLSLGTFILLVVAIGPFAAWFYNEPILSLIIPAIGISVFLSPLNLVHRVRLTKDLNFKSLGIISIISSIAGGVFAIALALLGAGVWSIVAQSVIATLVSIPLMWRTTQWWPRFQFSKDAVNDVFRIGVFDMLKRTFVFLTKNIDYLLIGRLLGADLVGIYTLAFLLTDTFRQQLMGVMNKVMFPVYGKLQSKLDEVKSYYVQIIKYNALIVTLFMTIFVFYASPLIHLLFGSRWELATFPLQALAIASVIHAIGGTSDAVLRGIGRFDIDFKIYLLKTILITIPAFFVGVYYFGINGASVAVVLHKLTSRIIYQFQLKRLVGITERDIWKAFKPTMLAFLSTIPIAIIYNTYFEKSHFFLFLITVILTGFVYSTTGLFLIRKEVKHIISFISQGQKSNG